MGMARQFSEAEKTDIRGLLITKGRELFGARGLKKTTVDDITKEVGIAQGSFYAFFDSKEDLYFEILEMEERELWKSLQSRLVSIPLTRRNFRQFMSFSLALVHENPFIDDLIRNNSYQKLLRKIPKPRMERHLREETSILMDSIESYRRGGLITAVEPRVLAGLFHGLFLLYLHKKDIGVDIFDDVMGLFLDVTADGLVTTGDRNRA
jgi:AcrR family transcriptional regulator